MMSEFGWAVVGPGRIANRFADAVKQLPQARLAAVHGRNPRHAATFAQAWSGDQAQPAAVAEDLDALLSDHRVDGVYVATPHAFHADAVRRCLLAGKPVLCEKSLTPNASLSSELTALSRQYGVFLMEAVWTRFLPVYSTIHDWLSRQAIGPIRGLQSSFCFNVPFDPQARHFDPAQAGGALLDIGVYNLSMTQWVLHAALGQCPALQSLDVHGTVGPTGVDHRVNASLHFPDGLTSQFQCAFDSRADNGLRIFGELGVISVPSNFWEATSARLQTFDKPPEVVTRPFRINGFEGEIEEAMACIARGEFQSAAMPHADTVAVAQWIDRMRSSLGVKYPFE
jgi:predicted dehydrogenase